MAILTDYEYEIMEPNSLLPCVNWIVTPPKSDKDTNSQRYAVSVKKHNVSKEDIDDHQSSTKIISGNMGASLLSIIITADTINSIPEDIKEKQPNQKSRF